MSKKKIRRGDVFLADLNPVVGSEEGGNRPVLIVQNNTGNRNSRTTIVAPITRKLTSSYLPVHVIVSPSVTGLQETSSVMLEQIRVMDKERLKEKVAIPYGACRQSYSCERGLKSRIQLKIWRENI